MASPRSQIALPVEILARICEYSLIHNHEILLHQRFIRSASLESFHYGNDELLPRSSFKCPLTCGTFPPSSSLAQLKTFTAAPLLKTLVLRAEVIRAFYGFSTFAFFLARQMPGTPYMLDQFFTLPQHMKNALHHILVHIYDPELAKATRGSLADERNIIYAMMAYFIKKGIKNCDNLETFTIISHRRMCSSWFFNSGERVISIFSHIPQKCHIEIKGYIKKMYMDVMKRWNVKRKQLIADELLEAEGGNPLATFRELKEETLGEEVNIKLAV
ncbi:MAG: hypothetical protein M1834_003071 [Cirrosporium novae-zelandiae]|nr:MAG: hypothetical protein M1834_003071 [Cirrosporium novae-zelandiae]